MRQRGFLAACCLLLAAFASLPPAHCAPGGSWPRWRGPDGDGISRETGWNPKALTGGPRVLWRADIGFGFSSAAIEGRRLYTMGCKGENYILWCLNADTGKTIWRYEFPNLYRDPQATPTIDRDSVYALGWEGILFCLNSADGKLTWKKDLVADFGAVQ